ncbi:MAG: TraR/DksA C4-type zinc finger protein [Kiritimatiellae bacterium]|nr:TraR/DksA C4-type zinc finger protein [Kiritimatiellia bacterium]
MAIKKQPKVRASAKNVRKTPVKTASKKVLDRNSKSASAKKVSPPKAKAVAASKTKGSTVKATAKPTPKKVAATKTPTPKMAKKPLPKKALLASAKEVSSTGSAAAPIKDHRFNHKDLEQFRIELLAMRERITGQSGSMRNEALQRNDEVNLEEEGTDAFIRLQTLAQVGTQQQIVSSIDEALRAIEKSVYGICDMCGALIGKSRLKVLPFAKNCINCQSEIEQSRYQLGRR